MSNRAMTAVLALCCLLALSPVSHAATVIMHDSGYLYVTGSFPDCAVGDELGGVGFVSSTSSPISCDLSLNELTWSLAGLTVTDRFTVSTRVYTNFTGGTVKIFVDPSMNGDYGLEPPNGTSPSTFVDGELFLYGQITSSYMSYDTVRQNGALVALVNFTNGTGLTTLDEPNGNIVQFTFGPADPNIPPGYEMQAIGYIAVPALCTVMGNVSYRYDEAGCERCDGITRLVLDYAGAADLSTVAMSANVDWTVSGLQLVLTPNGIEEMLPGNVDISIGGVDYTIHTSCSRPLDVGNVIGDFTVAAVDKIMVPCATEVCDGITRLVLRYLGIGDPATVTVSEGATTTVAGDLVTILPTDDELRGNTTVAIGGDEVTIHTSCSQPIDPGFVFDCFEVVAVDKTFPEGGGTLPATGPVVGATIDLVDGEGTIHSTLTDENGNYVFFDVATDSLNVSCVVPMGYSPVTPTDVDVVCLPGGTAVVDFLLERLATEDRPRSTGFWKHQIVSALKGKQKGVQVPADQLLACFDAIHGRFDQYFEIFIPVRTLEDFYEVVSVKKATQYEKARKEFAGLLLNTVSNRLSTWQFISEDEATVSQAISHVSDLLIDGIDMNDGIAHQIAEAINNGRPVPAGLIPLDTRQIAYSRRDDGGDAPPSSLRE